MKCSACRERLAAYRDGDVSPASAALIAAHLEQCNDCAAFWEGLAEVDRRLQALTEIEPRADFTQLIMAKVAAMPAYAPVQNRLRVWWIGLYELIAWVAVVALTAAGILNWKGVVADAGVLVGKYGVLAEDLYRLASHYHLGIYAAVGTAVECMLFFLALVFARRYLGNLRSALFGVQTA